MLNFINITTVRDRRKRQKKDQNDLRVCAMLNPGWNVKIHHIKYIISIFSRNTLYSIYIYQNSVLRKAIF